MLLLGSFQAHAGFEVREMGLNGPGYGDNVQVIPMNNDLEAAKLRFSYDVDEIEFNHQYKAAKHLIDRLPLADQSKIKLFWHHAMIEKALMPESLTEGSVTLKNILLKSPYDTAMIKNDADFQAFVRHSYTEKLNQILPVKVIEKNGNLFRYQISNNTDYRIKKIHVNFRVMDAQSGRIYMDEMVTESGMFLAPKKTGHYTFNQPSRLEGWSSIQQGLLYKVTVTKVEFYGGKVFDADRMYHAIKDSQLKLDPHPFTEI